MRITKDLPESSPLISGLMDLAAATRKVVRDGIEKAMATADLMLHSPSAPIGLLTRWLGDRGLCIHYIDEGKTGSVALINYDNGHAGRLAWEWGFKKVGASVEFNSGGDYDVAVSLGLPGICLWASFERTGLPKWLERHIRSVVHRWSIQYKIEAAIVRVDEHETDVSLRWNLGMDPDTGSSTDPKWRRGSLSLQRLVFGPERFTVVASHEHRVIVPLPEGKVGALAKWTKHKRQREHGKPVYYTTVSFDFDTPVRVGDHKDRHWTGIGTDGATIEDGIGKAVSRILTARKENWVGLDGAPLSS